MAVDEIVPMQYPRNPREKTTVRPFRLWDANKRKCLPSRNYSDLRRCHMGALIEARWAAVGTCIEVFDITKGKLKGQYIRRVNNVEFMEA